MLGVQGIPQESCKTGGDKGVNFSGEVCLPYLLAAQNSDGGWGFRPGAQSRTEPTAWAVIALAQAFAGREAKEMRAGAEFLRRTQRVDGSWAAAAGVSQGSAVSSLACWALLAAKEEGEELRRGLRWVVADRPGDSGRWWRFVRWFANDKSVNDQNEKYWGWSWTPGTASWVEPTAYALIVLRAAPASVLPAGVEARVKRAEAMLFDRMCPGGGWNCGDPMVYGVPGEPQVSTTVWPLLALRECAGRDEIQKSAAWLEKNWSAVQSPASLALTQIALNAFGHGKNEFGATLEGLYAPDAIAWSVPVAAWSALALCAAKFWLAAGAAEKN